MFICWFFILVMRDQLNRALYFDFVPKRIVCLVPSLTEMLVDLGLQGKIVGVTKFCIHPNDIKKTAEVIGGTKSIKIDKIKDLHPDFILANKEENGFEDISLLSRRHLIYVSDIKNLEDLFQLIKDLGDIFRISTKADQLVRTIHASYNDFITEIQHLPRLKIAYFIWKEPWMVVGSSTFINYVLKLNNLENAYEDFQRYPEVNIKTLKPVDYLFLSSEPFPFKDKHKLEFEINPEKVIIVDGEFFSWYGSRLIKAFEYFKKLRNNL